ncbi:enoyl-CoA hydratase/isomerase family protein [Roseixanthobacter pseudopolyaromaticivorans]|uniref:enoyl-CoA hydratase/isomerase family protein n=1 Tax=Xanthobacteraceae TaxID=335928 RepID=UPI00372BF30E
MSGEIKFEMQEAIGVVTIHNPGKRNALTVAMWTSLRDLFLRLDAERACRCILLTGGGGAFAAGADISEFEQERSTRAQVTRYHEVHVGPALDAILRCGIPTVAKIRDACMGGGMEIAALCDLRIASTDAKFGIPINRMGFPLAFGETELLFKLFGRGVLAELVLEGRVFAADEALQKGIVQRVVAPDALDDEAMATALRIAGGSPLAHRSSKAQLLRLLRDWTPVSAEERAAFYDFAETQDYKAGYEAFLKKERAVFSGI